MQQYTISHDRMYDVMYNMCDVYKGKKIEFIQVVRNITGLGFKDAKDLVELVSQRHYEDNKKIRKSTI